MSFHVLLQLAASGVCLAGVCALLGASWAVIFSTTRVFHVAHGVTAALGGYLMIDLANDRGLPPLVATLIAGLGCLGLGVIFEILLYRPLKRRGTKAMSVFVASLGATLLGGALLMLCYGPNPRILDGMPGVFSIGSLRLTSAQVMGGLVGATVTLVFLFIWSRTWFGTVLRAVVSNPEAAERAGINVQRQRLVAMAVGSALGGVAGALFALSQGVGPDFALNSVLLATVAVLVGGMGSVPGAAVGGVLLALVMDIGIWPLSSRWQYSVTFGLLVIVLLVRPRGLFGERLAQADL